jgi:hypothetical protein
MNQKKILSEINRIREISKLPMNEDLAKDIVGLMMGKEINADDISKNIFNVKNNDKIKPNTKNKNELGVDISPTTQGNFDEMTKLVINKIEGGYYNPEWHYKRAMGRSGETMFGIDRKHGGNLNTSPAGVEFWSIIDKNKTKDVWKHGYRGGELENQLRDLVVKIMKPHYTSLSEKYLTDGARQIVNSDNPLLFHFIYASWNGPGFFKKFAEKINKAVKDGVTSREELRDLAIDSRKESAVARSANKIEGIMDNLA